MTKPSIRLRSMVVKAVPVFLLAGTLLQPVPVRAATPPFELLLEVTLTAEAEVSGFVEAEDPFDRSFSMKRDLIAQGEGKAIGVLPGEIRWSLLGRDVPQADRARIHLTGWLETPDGAEVFFVATGLALEPAATLTGSTLLLASGRFEAELEPDYDWLNSVLAWWRGRFDPETRTFTFQVWTSPESVERSKDAEVTHQ